MRKKKRVLYCVVLFNYNESDIYIHINHPNQVLKTNRLELTYIPAQIYDLPPVYIFKAVCLTKTDIRVQVYYIVTRAWVYPYKPNNFLTNFKNKILLYNRILTTNQLVT